MTTDPRWIYTRYPRLFLSCEKCGKLFTYLIEWVMISYPVWELWCQDCQVRHGLITILPRYEPARLLPPRPPQNRGKRLRKVISKLVGQKKSSPTSSKSSSLVNHIGNGMQAPITNRARNLTLVHGNRQEEVIPQTGI